MHDDLYWAAYEFCTAAHIETDHILDKDERRKAIAEYARPLNEFNYK